MSMQVEENRYVVLYLYYHSLVWFFQRIFYTLQIEREELR
jgi:hypothetical protein